VQVCSGGQCRNTPGSFQCICPTGTQLNPHTFVCEDVDECRELGPEACFNGECVNTFGSYKCECDPGSILDNTGRICIGWTANEIDFPNCMRLSRQSQRFVLDQTQPRTLREQLAATEQTLGVLLFYRSRVGFPLHTMQPQRVRLSQRLRQNRRQNLHGHQRVRFAPRHLQRRHLRQH
jgi:hypothetical protein